MNKKTAYPRQSIGRDAAVKLAESSWWEGKSARDIVRFQLFTEELSMPFDRFHQAVEETLGRPVFTHEFGLNYDGICMEFLGEADAPTMQEILDLIPESQRIVVERP